jgi:hypothetical protein
MSDFAIVSVRERFARLDPPWKLDDQVDGPDEQGLYRIQAVEAGTPEGPGTVTGIGNTPGVAAANCWVNYVEQHGLPGAEPDLK